MQASDINLKSQRISVSKSLVFAGNKGRLKTTTDKKPGTKSWAGVRDVPIPAILLSFLEKAVNDKAPNDVLFPKTDGQLATKQACDWWWNSFLRQCHIAAGAKLYRNKVQIDTSLFDNGITPHYLRHTYATDLYAAGIDDKAQKVFMGHSSQDVTDIYRKMNESAFNRALQQLNEYYGGINFDL